MTLTRSGIPTTYRGTEFRSRLEARWAAFFDLVEWPWVYEPIDAQGYIPDFLIKGARPFYVEVGPCVTTDDYRAKAEKADANALLLGRDLLVVGVDILAPTTDAWSSRAGWLGEYGLVDMLDEREPWLGFGWGWGVWSTCTVDERTEARYREQGIDFRGAPSGCGRVGVAHESQSFALRPCSHYPGGDIYHCQADLGWLWAQAGNTVQWRP